MRKKILFLYFLLSLSFAKAQSLYADDQKYLDSLTAVLHSGTVGDSAKVRSCIALSAYWVVKDEKKSQQYLYEGSRWSGNNAYLKGLLKVGEGNFYYPRDAEKSRNAYIQADAVLNKYKSREAYSVRSNLWAKLGALRQREDDDPGYVDLVLHKAIPLALAAGDSDLVGGQYTGIGVAFMNLSQNKDAENYLNKAILILQNKDPYKLAAAYNRAGENYYLLKKLDKVKEILEINKKILPQFPHSPLWAGYYMLDGLYAHENKEYKHAIASFDKGIAAADGLNKYYVIQELDFYKLESLLADKQYYSAHALLKEMVCDEELMSMEQNRLEIYQKSAQLYAGLHRMDSAYYYQAQYSELSDSLHEQSFRAEINKMTEKYQSAEKEKKIGMLESKQKASQLEARNKNTLIVALVIVCALLLLLAVLTWSSYRKSKRLHQQQELLHRQELLQKERSLQLESIRALLEGEEKERSRLARDLHDGLGGMLTSLKLKLSPIADANEWNITPEKLARISDPIDHTLQELRRISRNMAPPTLMQFGLEIALNDLCQSLSSPTTKITFQPIGIQPSMSEKDQLLVYRIVQELLANAVKHARASRILLQCSQNDRLFLITVEDDGQGFVPDTLIKKGMGLSNIEHRIRYMNGKMDIRSDKGKGTSFNIELQLT